MRVRLLAGVAAFGCLTHLSTAHAAPSACDAVAGNLVGNCGFEAANGANTAYPAGWNTDAGYALNAGGFNQVVANNQNSGLNALQFANYDAQGPAGISQTLITVAGQNYQASFFAFDGGAGGDANAFLKALVNGTAVVTLGGNDAGVGSYAQYTFSFVGTGSDTIGFEAQTNPSEWFLDDVVVQGPRGATAVPEPATLTLLGAGVIGMSAAARRRKAA